MAVLYSVWIGMLNLLKDEQFYITRSARARGVLWDGSQVPRVPRNFFVPTLSFLLLVARSGIVAQSVTASL